MRIGRVVGKVTLVKAHPSLVGKRFVLTTPLDLAALAADAPGAADEIVAIDELGCAPGDRIGLSEGMEATFPYYPAKVPVDVYAACILDECLLDAKETKRLLDRKK